MLQLKPPTDFKAVLKPERRSVFLCGSIEMGKATDWQMTFTEALYGFNNVVILNPRRDNWDASWEQSIENPIFHEQVQWELSALEASDLIVVYFQPGTQSPITLFELGFFASEAPEKLIVCCPDGFWRKGNVDIVCHRYGIEQASDINELTEKAKKRLLSAH